MLTPSLVYDGSAIGVLQGGAREGETFVGSLHVRLHATAPETSAWAGTTALMDIRSLHGTPPGAWVGDAQGVTNIAGPSGTDIEELWVQHNFRNSTMSVLGGIYDLNTEFYHLQAAGLFLNSSFGMGPEFSQSGVEGPSIFPRTAMGVRVAAKPAPGMVLRAALLDGVPVVRPDGSRGAFRPGDGALAVAEAAFLSRPTKAADDQTSPRDRIGRFSSLSPYQDKLALGVWHYTGSYPDVGPAGALGALHHGSTGGYAIGEWRLLGRSADAEQTLAGFMQLGTADASTNRFQTYIGMGLVGTGWVPGRPSDQIGLAIASARNGSPYRQSQRIQRQDTAAAETAVELSYLTQITKWLIVQPDLQYVMRPNGSFTLRNAWVAQLRFELTF
ncbi:carbohydrate porin [Variovorax ginsengisoli]|uniref:Carbohydrate porin n=1 Tax=Variovorax ginsengisoli TaxID=363844 RepID=A0ABT8SDC7_9BURK|nr:carbohydrate porin [Variovorax ginsengisoli]MDN8617765.1 carbohydrate porin [Variovorax ginsengisoli]MDO1536935.1 carbohydrate porin [Variovorax ginsengisoli]